MNTFEKIVEAIKPFKIPYAPDIYYGSTEKHFVYNYVFDASGICADDDMIEAVADIQLHLYMPVSENFISLKNEIRHALIKQGFTSPEITQIIEKKTRHIIFECEIEEE